MNSSNVVVKAALGPTVCHFLRHVRFFILFLTPSEASAQITLHDCQNKMAESGVPQMIPSILPFALQNDVSQLSRTLNSSAKCSKQQGVIFLPGCDLVHHLGKVVFPWCWPFRFLGITRFHYSTSPPLFFSLRVCIPSGRLHPCFTVFGVIS